MSEKSKTIEEINQKLKDGTAVVLTAEEVSKMAKNKSVDEIFETVDVVTTATFGAMCSSGAFINVGHAGPDPIRIEDLRLNGVKVCSGIAAVDAYIGATEEGPNPKYGGAHLIEDLIAGKKIKLKARGKGTDCYPLKEIETEIDISSINEAYLFNPRNAYQNYAVAINSGDKTAYTYMGALLPRTQNATYSTSGELSPLLNDPDLETIGIGTKIFLGGATGYVSWHGTQFSTNKEVNENGVPVGNARTLAVIGDLKAMSTDYVRAACINKYGVSLFVGIGIPIPVINTKVAQNVMIRNSEIDAFVCDYGKSGHPTVAKVNYEQLQSGKIILDGKEVRTAPLSSLKKAREIADLLKNEIKEGRFELTAPVASLPTTGVVGPMNQKKL